MKVELAFEAKDTLKKLNLAQKDMNKIARKMIAKISQTLRKEVRLNLKGSVLKRRSGSLYKNITYKANANFSGFLKIGSFYASFLERDTEIQARNKDYLTFQVEDGRWVKVKRVFQAARPFVKPVKEKYFDGSPELTKKIMDKVLDEELKKIMGE